MSSGPHRRLYTAGRQDGRNRDGMTLEQIGDQFGLTRERIRQIELKALRKLRKAFERELTDEEIRDLLS